MKHSKRSCIINNQRIFFALFSCVLIVLYLMKLYELSLTIESVLIIISFLIIIFPMFFLNDIFHPFILLSISMLLAVTDFLSINLMIDFNGKLPWIEESKFTIYSLLIFITWYLCMYYGYYFSAKSKNTNENTISFKKINHPGKISFIFIFLVLLTFIYTIITLSGLKGMVQSMINTTNVYSGLGYLRQIVGLGLIASLLFLYAKFYKISMITMILTCSALTFFGGRAAVVLGVVLPFMMVFHYSIKKLKLWILVIVSLLGLLFIEILGMFRTNTSTLPFNGLLDIITNAARATGRGETLPSLIGSILNNEVNLQWGSPLINIFYAPIPRGMWEGKPTIIDESILVSSELLGTTDYGLPIGPYGWAFFNFGWLGVIIFAFITGYLVRKLYETFILTKNNEDSIYIVGVIFYSLIIRSIYDIFATSSQINILWYIGIFILIYIVDFIFHIFTRNKRYVRSTLR